MIKYLLNEITIPVSLFGLITFTQSCQHKKQDLTELERRSVTDSAKLIVQKVFNASNNLEFMNGLDHYSGDADTYYINNGTILSLQDLKESYSLIGPSVELLENSIDRWHSTVLSENTVAFTLPIHLRIKLKGIPEYKGQLTWSGIVQKRNEKWMVIQSHESWLNCAEVMKALTPAANKEE